MQAFIPIIGIFLNIFIQAFSFRFIKRLGLLKSEYLGFFAGFIYLLVMGIFTGSGLAYLAANLIIYSCLGYCYFHFINLGETGRRIRLLWEIYDNRRGLTQDELLQRYNAQEILQIRLKRLLKNKQIILKQERYYIGIPAMLYITKLIILMKKIILNR